MDVLKLSCSLYLTSPFLRIVFLSFALCCNAMFSIQRAGVCLVPKAKLFNYFIHDSSIEKHMHTKRSNGKHIKGHRNPCTWKHLLSGVYGTSFSFFGFDTTWTQFRCAHHNDDMKHSKTQTIIYYAVLFNADSVNSIGIGSSNIISSVVSAWNCHAYSEHYLTSSNAYTWTLRALRLAFLFQCTFYHPKQSNACSRHQTTLTSMCKKKIYKIKCQHTVSSSKYGWQ